MNLFDTFCDCGIGMSRIGRGKVDHGGKARGRTKSRGKGRSDCEPEAEGERLWIMQRQR